MAVKGYGSKNTVGKMGWIDYVSRDSTKADEQKMCNLPMAKDTKGKTLPLFEAHRLSAERDRHEPKTGNVQMS